MVYLLFMGKYIELLHIFMVNVEKEMLMLKKRILDVIKKGLE